ncbi:NAD(P)/FAD-dependent oxidoreductase [Solirhodobacter olei]|uniref:NAD(P)/FAD-dependent oxidoreductase n=1 Tax=Solirhodobacter olei TaxID=2493082 RepID=UPI000FD7DF71|nr:FAD-dependent oxidoreductase [Solirhodobacter olei]
MAAREAEVAIVGAGVVGLTLALRLARAGREVVLIDPNPPGSGASFGNAGTIADYAVMPVGTPDVLKSLPSLLFDRNSPLAIRKAALPTLAPWLLRFAAQSLPGPARRNSAVLARLLSDAGARWRDLAAEVGAAEGLGQTGNLYLYDTPRDVEAAKADLAHRRTLGVTVEILTADELGQLEPNLPRRFAGAAFFPNTWFLSDPGRTVTAIATAAQAAGARIVTAEARALRREGGGVTIETQGPEGPRTLGAARAVIAAGARSRALARSAGDRIPLDTERGYHVEWDMAEAPVARPSCPVSRGFYFCPMSGRLRAAGTVELGGLNAPPSPHRIARIIEGSRAVFPDLPAPSRTWLGFRPSMPDSLPVIGPSKAGPEILLAFGHGHIGLTLAPRTAALIEGHLAGTPPDPALAGVLPARF